MSIRQHRQIDARMRESGLKVTPQRCAILEFIASHPEHPTVDEVYRAVNERFPRASRATVYNTVSALERAGLMHALRLEDGVTRFDANLVPHHHFICRRCRRILDVPLESVHGRIRLSGEHHMESYEIILRGQCANCH